MAMITKILNKEFHLMPTGSVMPKAYNKNDVYSCCVCGFVPWPSNGCTRGLNTKHIYQEDHGDDLYVIPNTEEHKARACIDILKLTPPIDTK